MGDSKRRIDKVLTEDYLNDLGSRSIDEIRAMRAECSQEEALVSYERRMLHGRMSLLRFELDRRAGKEEGSLVDNLTKILTDDSRSSTRGSIPLQDPDLEAFGEPTRSLSKLVSDDTLARLPDLDDAEVRSYLTKLEEAEHEVSEIRSKLLGVMDALIAELSKRYQTGEADPSDVLT